MSLAGLPRDIVELQRERNRIESEWLLVLSRAYGAIEPDDALRVDGGAE